MPINIDSFPGRELVVDEDRYLYFGGTAYLGLQDYPEFQELFIKNIRKFGTNYSASRKSNVRFSIFETAEQYLSELVGSEACITQSSGYLAGQFLSEYIHKKSCKAFYAPNTHSALFRNRVKNYVTYASLNIALRNYLNEPNAKTPVLFLDAIDFSGGNFPDFENLKILPINQMIVVADDSHGIGVIGKNGGGVFRSLRALNPKELYICCSLGKGFGIQAGAIFGNKEDLSIMENTSFYGGASPASPAAMATLLEANDIYEERRDMLNFNLDYFMGCTESLKKFRYMKGHPTFTFLNQELAAFLEREKIIVTHFNYPKENSETMSRIVLSASHIKKDIDTLASAINTFRSK
ncbi:pyridoxal phosphate-dependent aminotransferase family protein [Maribacter sp. PR1]|uniref:Pyridoxal phosphate-dependent aminotransferase family protein n=1 Tax=Maribacter cobaltidurans TaxID=1178778 RepID=A0ABU7IUU5_9FLAO|nr:MULTISPECIES: pyridoxal phosphate-dependent aminotransferase family protein [Maribacter]MDC6389341.1 pyridoxal phosphate-dependent aminotransferase family protein [Maribacter sp. PR1]MEE1976729.1 pyridoxal phosphate-dependent aminotransferase family protein [Maribacter cobaltidurans]